MANEKKEHYVNNKQLYEEMCKFKDLIYDHEQSGLEKPPVTEYLGECFLKIATGLAQRPNFINYTYKDEMICDGIENCIQYCHNFDPEKSKNPFSYFTQIIYYAFLRRIEREKRQSYIKHKLTEKLATMADLAALQDHDLNSKETLQVYMNENSAIVQEYEEKINKKRISRHKAKSNLETFME